MNRQITIAGIGSGNLDGCTLQVLKAAKQADILIGAHRMINTFSSLKKPKFISFSPNDIVDFAENHPEYHHIMILVAGDTGFYSNAKGISSAFSSDTKNSYEICFLCGVSSVAAFCAKLKISWEDSCLLSIHGRKQNLIYFIARKEKTISLLSKKEDIISLCKKLISYGLGAVKLSLGKDLSYPSEQIIQGNAEHIINLAQELQDGLWILLAENQLYIEHHQYFLSRHIPDYAWIRQTQKPLVPMTKEDIRLISIAKLQLTDNAILYDIGAGTGTIGIEASLIAPDIQVFAIEQKEYACNLIKKNCLRFAADNVIILSGTAPAVLDKLPMPSHAFIGGSSGNLTEIVAKLLEKNPAIRIVINAISLETIAEATRILQNFSVCDVDISQIQTGYSKKIANYHMINSGNPVTIFSFTGNSISESEFYKNS